MEEGLWNRGSASPRFVREALYWLSTLKLSNFQTLTRGAGAGALAAREPYDMDIRHAGISCCSGRWNNLRSCGNITKPTSLEMEVKAPV